MLTLVHVAKALFDNVIFGRLRTSSEVSGILGSCHLKTLALPRYKSHAYNSEKVGRYITVILDCFWLT